MREIPFVATQDEVLEILRSGRVQFRRLFKPQPELVTAGGAWLYDGEIFVGDDAMQSHLFHDVYGNGKSPYGSVYGDGTADRLRFREGFYVLPEIWRTTHGRQPIHYAADITDRDMVEDYVKKPPASMPRWASRIVAGVTDVRVERLQDMSDKDVWELGIKDGQSYDLTGITRGAGERAFKPLWDSINAKRGHPWSNNDWVWVIDAARI